MSLLSDFFIATEFDALTYDGAPGFLASDRVRLNGITPLEAASLLEALRAAGDSVEMISEFPLLTPQDAQAWTMGVPEDFVSRLAALPESSVPEIAGRFADITAEELGWSAEEASSMIAEIRMLARRSTEMRKPMFLWNSF